MIEKLNYRPELDGIRGYSLLFVLFYHVGLESVIPGTYIAVDLFFTVSGYIITKMILAEFFENKKFDFGHFYTRRARRLLPGLLNTVVIAVLLSFIAFPLHVFKQTISSAANALMGTGNIYFFFNSGYFDGLSRNIPLLHTWSLGVEEQFYLLWPLFLVGTFSIKNKLNRRLAFFSVFILSFAINLLYDENKYAMYYMMPYRAYEFWLGAAVVFLEARKKCPNYLKDLLHIICLSIIAYSALYLNSEMAIPSYTVLPACLAACGIIWAGESIYVRQILSNKFIVWLGKISYSVYLIHWPIMVIYRFYYLESFKKLPVQIGIVLACIFAGWLQYKFVENPFRIHKNENKTRVSGAVFGLRYLLIVLPLIMSLYMIKENWWPNKKDAFVTNKMINSQEQILELKLENMCYFNDRYNEEKVFDIYGKLKSRCKPKAKYQVLTLGNSHEMSTAITYQEIFSLFDDEVNIVSVDSLYRSRQKCYFYFNTKSGLNGSITSKSEVCAKFIQPLNDLDKIADEFDVILLGLFNPLVRGREFLEYVNTLQAKHPDIKIILHGSIYDTSPYKCLDLLNTTRDKKACNRHFNSPGWNYFNPNEEQDVKKEFPNLKFKYVNMLEKVCPEKTRESCLLVHQKMPLFFDQNHFNYYGMRSNANMIQQDKKLFNELKEFIKTP